MKKVNFNASYEQYSSPSQSFSNQNQLCSCDQQQQQNSHHQSYSFQQNNIQNINNNQIIINNITDANTEIGNIQKQLTDLIAIRSSMQPLDKNIFMQILELEEQIMFKENYTKEIVQQLIELYAQCVEHYDSIKDPIADYFLEKIQMTVASKETLEMLHNKKKYLRESLSQFNSLTQGQLALVLQNSNDSQDPSFSSQNHLENSSLSLFSKQQSNDFHAKQKQKYKQMLSQDKKIKYSLSKKKKERSQKIALYQEQQDFLKQNNLNSMQKNLELIQINNKKIIDEELEQQNDLLQQRLKKRQQKIQAKKQKQQQNSKITIDPQQQLQYTNESFGDQNSPKIIHQETQASMSSCFYNEEDNKELALQNQAKEQQDNNCLHDGQNDNCFIENNDNDQNSFNSPRVSIIDSDPDINQEEIYQQNQLQNEDDLSNNK